MTTQATREYLAHLWKQYKTADRRLKSQILDELVRNLGTHLKAATRLMNRRYPPGSLQGFKGGRKPRYSPKAKSHLERIWRPMGLMWPKRLKAALPDWLPFDEHPDCDEAIKAELLAMSASSIRL